MIDWFQSILVEPCECPRCRKIQLDDLGMCKAPVPDSEVDSLLEVFFGRYVDEFGRVRDTITGAPGWVVECSEAMRAARADRLRKEEETRKMQEDFDARFKRS